MVVPRARFLARDQSGKLSATRDEATGSWLIEPAELHRIYPAGPDTLLVQSATAPLRSSTGVLHRGATGALQGRLEAAEARIAKMLESQRLRDEVIEDRGNSATARKKHALAAAQERIAALLTDQRIAPLRRLGAHGGAGGGHDHVLNRNAASGRSCSRGTPVFASISATYSAGMVPERDTRAGERSRSRASACTLPAAAIAFCNPGGRSRRLNIASLEKGRRSMIVVDPREPRYPGRRPQHAAHSRHGAGHRDDQLPAEQQPDANPELAMIFDWRFYRTARLARNPNRS